MKLSLLSTTIIVVLFLTTASAENPLCMICNPQFSIPTTWSGTQSLLKMGCAKLPYGQAPCNGLIDNADLTSSYPNMYPHLVNLKNIGCKKLCA